MVNAVYSEVYPRKTLVSIVLIDKCRRDALVFKSGVLRTRAPCASTVHRPKRFTFL